MKFETCAAMKRKVQRKQEEIRRNQRRKQVEIFSSQQEPKKEMTRNSAWALYATAALLQN